MGPELLFLLYYNPKSGKRKAVCLFKFYGKVDAGGQPSFLSCGVTCRLETKKR